MSEIDNIFDDAYWAKVDATAQEEQNLGFPVMGGLTDGACLSQGPNYASVEVIEMLGEEPAPAPRLSEMDRRARAGAHVVVFVAPEQSDIL